MKSYTDIEQSKKLAEFLPIESADMCFYYKDDIPQLVPFSKHNNRFYIPCWSLTALLEVLPKNIGRYTKSLYWFDEAWHCEYEDEDSEGLYGASADEPIDACYKMILELHELNLL